MSPPKQSAWPTAWQRKASKVSGLRAEYLSRRKLPFRRKGGAPFFVPASHSHEHWPVGLPLSGGNDGGYVAGAAMARALVRFYANGRPADGRPPAEALRVWWVVQSLARRSEAARARCAGDSLAKSKDPARLIRESNAADAQFFGFCQELQRWLVMGALAFADALGNLSDADLATMAEAGLGYDEEAACRAALLASGRRPRREVDA